MSEPSEAGHRPWFGGSVRRFGDSMMGLLETRLEILEVEWAEERSNLVRLLFAVFVSLWCLHLSVVLGLVYVLLVVGEANRVAVLGLGALVLLLVSAGCLVWLRAWLKRRAPMFATTRAELRKDRDWLRGRS